MPRRIKGLFQKKLCQKTKETGAEWTARKADSRGCFAVENATQERTQQNQHGRSMVEMIAVLVIIGVLSIGALAGYQYAMNKYRAGETINDINSRGVDLMIQASRNIPLNLDEWGNRSRAGYTFGAPERTTDGFIKLPISGLPKRVCDMVVEDLSAQFDIDVGADRYAGDTSLCGDNNMVTVYFEIDSGATCEGVTCPECQLCVRGVCKSAPDNLNCVGGYCESGICVKEERPKITDFTCHAVQDCAGSDSECVVCNNNQCDNISLNGHECYTDDTKEAGVCYNGYCQTGHCTTNAMCPSGYFCADTNESSEEAHPNKCQKLNFVRKTITLSDGTTETWYMSKYKTSWWDAKSACERMGKRMVNANELIVGLDKTQSWSEYTRTERMEKLYDAFSTSGTSVWLTDHHDSGRAFYTCLANGNTGETRHNNIGVLISALCH